MTAPEPSAVGRLAEEADPERWLAARLAPAAGRESIFALIAFNAELAKIPVTVSEPMLGEIRLQWWRDALDDLFVRGVARGHEVMQALAGTMQTAGWDADLMIAMVEARRFSLDGLPTDSAARDRFLDDTGGAYHRLAVGALGGRGPDAQHVAGLAGWAEGAARLIEAVRHEAGAAGADGAAPILDALAAEARGKLAEARARRRHVPFSARGPLMSVLFAEAALTGVGGPAAGDGFAARLRLGWRMATRRF